jgi:hypothetical protein
VLGFEPRSLARAANDRCSDPGAYSPRCDAFFAEHAVTSLAFAGDVMRAWRRIKAGAAKADYWRYCAMYVFGGVWRLDSSHSFGFNDESELS